MLGPNALKGMMMTVLRALSRGSVVTLLSAMMLSMSILIGSVLVARGSNHDQTYFACLYAGSMTQVNTTAPPANCGRGRQIQWTSATAATPPALVVRTDSQVVAPGATDFAIAECEPGEIATGGGYFASLITLVVNGSQPFPVDPLDPPTMWTAEGTNTSTTEKLLTAYVVCMSLGS
jgi:hypothetical protein